MEKLTLRGVQPVSTTRPAHAAIRTVTTSDWKQALPVLTGSMVTLRELRISDATSLLAMLSTEEVARFISPPPTTVEGFERFIAWTQRERAAGNYACFAVVPHGMDTAVGIFQVRQLEPGFSTAETPEAARALFASVVDAARQRHSPVETGEFGAHMRVSLVNDGPVTFWLRTAPGEAAVAAS